MTDPHADTSLKWILRLVGGVEVCAIPFIFFPQGWMDAIHDRLLGLGPLPDRPVVEYMARSLSALYAAHGAVIVRMSFDVRRFRPLIGFLGWAHVALGVTVFGSDLAAGVPWFWVLGEGPVIATGGALIVAMSWVRSPNSKTPAQVP